MRAAEIIRNMLDLFDNPDLGVSADSESQKPVVVTIQKTSIPEPSDDVETMARYRQIVDLLPDTCQDKEFVNSIDEKYADIESVLASGTDLMKSKNPADIRGEHISMYPSYQYDPNKE